MIARGLTIVGRGGVYLSCLLSVLFESVLFESIESIESIESLEPIESIEPIDSSVWS